MAVGIIFYRLLHLAMFCLTFHEPKYRFICGFHLQFANGMDELSGWRESEVRIGSAIELDWIYIGASEFG